MAAVLQPAYTLQTKAMEEPKNAKVQDEDRLAQLGYKQELQRDWSMLHNFGVSFSIIVSTTQASSCPERRPVSRKVR